MRTTMRASLSAGLAAVLVASTALTGVAADRSLNSTSVPLDATEGEGFFELGEPAESPYWASTSSEAQELAASLDAYVEDMSQRTESERVYAAPDGSWLAEDYLGTEWVQVAGDGDEPNDWAAIDTTLVVDDDGTVRPAVYATAFVLSGGGDTDTVLTRGFEGSDTALEIAWHGGELPVPELDGARATYEDIAPGVDYVVDLFSSGFEQYFVFDDRDALAAFDGLTLDIEVDNGGIEISDDSTLTIVDESGETLASLPAAYAWDANEDAKQSTPVLQPWSDEPNLSPGIRVLEGVLPEAAVDDIEQMTEGLLLPDEVEVAMDVTGTHTGATVALDLDMAWVADEDTEFPLVIDPVVVEGRDAYVNSKYPNASYATETELMIGYTSSSYGVFASLVGFDADDFTGDGKDQITSAYLKLYNHYSWSCTASAWTTILGEQVPAAVTWNTAPEAVSGSVTSTETKGYSSSCADGWVSSPDIAGWISYSIDQSAQNWSLIVQADDLSTPYSWKRFYSRDYGSDTSKHPRISYTYNTRPEAPTNVQVNGETSASHVVVDATYPTLSAEVTDAGDESRAWFAIFADGELMEDLGTDGIVKGTWVASGDRSVWEPPASKQDLFEQGVTYSFVYLGFDGALFSGDDPATSAEKKDWTQAEFTFSLTNHAPVKPTDVTMNQVPLPLTASGVHTETNRRPSFSATVADSDGTGKAAIEVWVYRDGHLIDKISPSGKVAAGGTSQVRLPFRMQPGFEYEFEVHSTDGVNSSTGSVSAGAVFVVSDPSMPTGVPTDCDGEVGVIAGGATECVGS
ncbi:DNRLRE domain-containing protein [Demequina sp. NBRC 110054]|uniref:DNRLRE domain-containing protein n=1 Tax=Demequina sp. NBRC 110054 TaxID=1570343 RepID=UPI001177DD1F|nr:DNRLRE domain-containing protein [Demequina sp. NBRC 110054]